MRKKKYLKNIGVLLTDKQYEQLVQITDEREITMSEYIREIVQEKIGHKNNGQKKRIRRSIKWKIENFTNHKDGENHFSGDHESFKSIDG